MWVKRRGQQWSFHIAATILASLTRVQEMAKYTTEIYKDKKGEFRWRRKDQSGNTVAASAKGFRSRSACQTNERGALVIGWKASQKVSAVEGYKLSKSMAGTFAAFSKGDSHHEERRSRLKKEFGRNQG
jgi:uncharacterized protein YegP (UPF0339 family)